MESSVLGWNDHTLSRGAKWEQNEDEITSVFPESGHELREPLKPKISTARSWDSF